MQHGRSQASELQLALPEALGFTELASLEAAVHQRRGSKRSTTARNAVQERHIAISTSAVKRVDEREDYRVPDIESIKATVGSLA